MKKINVDKLIPIQKAFLEAANCFIDHTSFARAIKRDRRWIHYILHQLYIPKTKKCRPISKELAIKIEKITQGKVKAYKLNPDIKK